MKSWLQGNPAKMYLALNEGKFVVAERFIRTVKKKNWKYINSISKNVYIDKLDDTINKYSNIYHITIKIKPIDIRSSKQVDCNKDNDK